MGTYLHFGLKDPSKTDEANKIYQTFWDDEDVRIEKEKGEEGQPDYLKIGHSTFKLSATSDEEMEEFIDGISKVREAGFAIDWSETFSDISDYVDDEMGKRMMGKPAWTKYKKRIEKWDKDYLVSKAIYEKSRRFVDKGISNPGIFSAIDNTGRKVHFMYGNCEYPEFLKVRPKKDPPMDLNVCETVNKGEKIILVPLQRMGTDKPFGECPNEYGYFELDSRLFAMGVRLNVVRMLYHLYRISIPLQWIESAKDGEGSEAMYFLTLEDIQQDLVEMGRSCGGLHYRNSKETAKVIRVFKRRKLIDTPEENKVMYLQFLLTAGEKLGMKKSDAYIHFMDGWEGPSD